MKKPAITLEPIADIIANRWSGRAYDASQACYAIANYQLP